MATQKQVFTEITESIDRCNHTLPGLIQFLKNGFQKLENATGGGGGGSTVAWTQTQAQATGTKIAEIEIDGDTTNVYAPAVSATQVQTTGTKIASLTIGADTTDLYAPTTSVSVQAEDVAYNNTVSGLTADDVQGAIDELAQGGSERDRVYRSSTATLSVDLSNNRTYFILTSGGGGAYDYAWIAFLNGTTPTYFQIAKGSQSVSISTSGTSVNISAGTTLAMMYVALD